MLKEMFDGDKLAVSIILTNEANEEALRFLEDPQSIFTLGGYNYRKVLNKESISGLYGLTKEDPKAKAIPDDLAKELIEGQDFKKMSEYIFDTYENGKIKTSKYKIESPCNFEYNNKTYKTTLGRAMFNYTICSIGGLDFENILLDKKNQERILNKMDALCMDALSKEDLAYFTGVYIPFLNKWEEFVFVCADLFSPSIDMDIYATSSEYDKFREKLLEENKEAIANGDLEVYDMVERELTKKFKETNKANTDIFDSGSKLSYGRDLRMGLISVGPMPIGVGAGKYAISTRGLLEGTTKEERATYAQSNIISGYFRAMGPAVGGEQAKEILAASHDIKLDVKGSDCGRTTGQWYTVNDYFVKELDMRFMIKSDKSLEMLTTETLKSKYYGKSIQVRAVHFCKNKKFCNICSGNKPYIIARGDTINIGAQTSIAGDEITQASLSKFHQNKTQFVNVDFNDFITPADFGLTESIVVSDEFRETFMNLQEMNDVLENEDNDVLADEITDGIDEIIDDIFLKNPNEFQDVLDGTHELDVHRLSMTKASLQEELLYLCNTSGRIISYVMRQFDGTPLNKSDNINIINVVNYLADTRDNINYMLKRAEQTDNIMEPYLVPVNDDAEYKYYKMHMVAFSVNYMEAIAQGVTSDIVRETLDTLALDLNISYRDAESTPRFEFTVEEDIDEENLYLIVSLRGLILDAMLIDLDCPYPDAYEKPVNIEEAVVLDSVTKRKMDSKIKSNKDHIRRKYEQAIVQAIRDAGTQKKKAKDGINETIEHKSKKLEADLRSSKDEYKKELSKMLQQFEVNFIKKNKFKLFKLRNKLNFIYGKKSLAIDSQMNEGIKALKHKMYAKQKEAESKIKTKFNTI